MYTLVHFKVVIHYFFLFLNRWTTCGRSRCSNSCSSLTGPSSRACSSSGAPETVTHGNRTGQASEVIATLPRTITTITNGTQTAGTTTTATGATAIGETCITRTSAPEETAITPLRGAETHGTAGGSAFKKSTLVLLKTIFFFYELFLSFVFLIDFYIYSGGLHITCFNKRNCSTTVGGTTNLTQGLGMLTRISLRCKNKKRKEKRRVTPYFKKKIYVSISGGHLCLYTFLFLGMFFLRTFSMYNIKVHQIIKFAMVDFCFYRNL